MLSVQSTQEIFLYSKISFALVQYPSFPATPRSFLKCTRIYFPRFNNHRLCFYCAVRIRSKRSFVIINISTCKLLGLFVWGFHVWGFFVWLLEGFLKPSAISYIFAFRTYLILAEVHSVSLVIPVELRPRSSASTELKQID